MHYDLYVGIDYSGAKYPESPLSSLQVFAARPSEPEAGCVRPPTRYRGRSANWSRRTIAHWLADLAHSEQRFIAGIDHCFSLPLTYFREHGLTSWARFLEDFARRWRTSSEGISVQGILPEILNTIDLSHDLRLAERWTQAAKSVFSFQGPGSVGKSTFAGIPWLHFLREQAGERLHFWPFDGFSLPPDRSVMVEVYPALCARRYPRDGRTQHEHDAYSVATWLRDMDEREALGRYVHPPLTPEEKECVRLEGWILGVG